MYTKRCLIIIGLMMFLFSGCASLKTEDPDFVADFPISEYENEYELPKIEYPEPEKIGVYHKVKRGETVWRIAKAYEVSINDIIEANNIPNAAQVDVNQLVFIPGAYAEKEIFIDTEESEKEFIWPIKGKVIKYFQVRKGSEVNKGIDIEAHDGEAVKASRSGKVVFADYLSGYGNTAILEHSGGFHTVYANNAKLLVKLGDSVLKGSKIAKVGRKNELVALHFEIRKNAIEDNPLYYLP